MWAHRQRLVLMSGFLLGLAPLALAQSVAPISIQQTETFGMVGLSTGQTARLNLLNPGSPSTATPTPLPPTPASCAAQLTFLDDQGNTLKTESVNVAFGKSVSFDLNRDVDVPSGSQQRIEIRGMVKLPGPTPIGIMTPGTGAPGLPIASVPFFCSLVPTFEIFNNDTGRTQLLLESTRFVPAAIPLPLAGGAVGGN